MKQINLTFLLFVATLPACYWTPWPSVLTLIAFLVGWGVSRVELRLDEKDKMQALTDEINRAYQERTFHVELSKKVDEIQTQVNALNLRFGAPIR